MNLFTKTLAQYIKSICQPLVLGQSKNQELRIFTSSIPVEAIFELGKFLTDYFINEPKTIKFIYKVGYPVFQEWKKNGDIQRAEAQEIINNDWVDENNRLTHYRNLKLEDDPDADGLVILLIGVEKATDSSSLKDFFIVDTESVWNTWMKKSFKPWIYDLLNQYNVPSEKSHIEEIDELLKVLLPRSSKMATHHELAHSHSPRKQHQKCAGELPGHCGLTHLRKN